MPAGAAVGLGLLGASLLIWRCSSDGGSAVVLATTLMMRDLRLAAGLLMGLAVAGIVTASVVTLGLEKFRRLDPTTDVIGTALVLLAALAFLGLARTVSIRVDRAVAIAHGRRNSRRSGP
jgi:hypothetical protein